MGRSKRAECNEIEDALADLVGVGTEARILLAHVQGARNLAASKLILLECAGNILDAATSARKRLSRLWERLEGETP